MKRKRKSPPKVKTPKSSVNSIQSLVVGFLSQNPGDSYQIRQILKALGIRDTRSKAIVSKAIFQLETRNVIEKLRNGAFTIVVQAAETMTGTVDWVNARFAYVVLDEKEAKEDIWVAKDDLLGALDGDKVRIIRKPVRSGKHPKGKVVEVLSRYRDEFVGRLEMSAKYGFVIPDFRKMFHDIYIPHEDLKGAKHNDKVIVKISRWPEHHKKPQGMVTRILGKTGEHNAEIHSIIAEFGLPLQFPEKVKEEAEAISDKITPKEIANRADFREVTTFTIDPSDAQDFDDALSIKPLPDGNTQVGIHIADVTHYVKEETAIDEEAIERATSVYLVDRTLPMLPERLSNGICSLRPHEEKLTFSAVFELDKTGNIRKEWFGRTVIYSNRRFTYEEAQECLEKGVGDFHKEIQVLDALAKKLRKKRFDNGAVNFEVAEVKFKLDEAGIPLGLIPKERKATHLLIEEFMLLANKRVAEFIFNKGKNSAFAFVYRTHDNPDAEKLDAFSNFARRFGHQLDFELKGISQSLNGLIESVEGKPEQNVLQQLAIRTMAKAQYTTETKGHFGLAFPHYTHFTSPIRRYPDMMVHRLLQHYLDGRKTTEKAACEALCVHSSEREKRAADAERASVKYKQVVFMELAAKKVFEGMVSGVTEWGIYVEITETKCEGMVRMADLEDDFYEYDEQNYRVIGRRTKRIISLGDKVGVKVKSTDIDRRTIDLIFVQNDP